MSYRPRYPEPAAETPGESYESYFRISTVRILTVEGEEVFEYSNGLLKRLDALGRANVPMRSVTVGGLAMHPASVGALNCYLRMFRGLGHFSRRIAAQVSPTKFNWNQLCQHLELRLVAEKQSSVSK